MVNSATLSAFAPIEDAAGDTLPAAAPLQAEVAAPRRSSCSVPVGSDVDLEHVVLGGLLSHGFDAFGDVVLCSEDFTSRIYGRVWSWLHLNPVSWVPGPDKFAEHQRVLDRAGLTASLASEVPISVLDFVRAARGLDAPAIAKRARAMLVASVSRKRRQIAADFSGGRISEAEFMTGYAAFGSRLDGSSHGPPEDSLLAALDQRRFGFIEPPAKPEPLLLIERNIIATAGNLVVIAAQAKTGKSAYLGAMMAAVLNPEANAADTLGVRSCGAGGRAVIHFDTEQSTFDHFALVSLSLRRAGLASPPPNLRSYCLADCSVADRRAMLRSELSRAGEIFAVFLDGVADFVHDPNDPEEAFGFVAELHRLAIENGCVFVGVLHENPGSTDSGKTRGHLGSQLERKAETNLRLGKSNGVSTVYTDRGARHCDIPKDFGTRFQYSAE